MDSTVYRLSEQTLKRHEKDCLQTWSEMRRERLLCDCVLQTEDGGFFTVHKAVLTLASKYFKALLTTKFSGRIRLDYCIPGISKYVLQQIIDYAYNGWVDLTHENVTKILIGADYLNVLGLLKNCCDFILAGMDSENCQSVKKFANYYFCFDLESAAERFIRSHFVEISKQSNEFLELPLQEVVELLNSELINVRTEEEVWEAGLRWIDHAPLERRDMVDSIMRCVRLGLLQTKYFLEHIKENRYVENNNACRPIVIETLKFLWDLELIEQQTEAVETPHLATPRIPYSILFTFGGWIRGVTTNFIETYDTKADRWIPIPDEDPAGPRAYHKLAVIGFDIYVIGGYDGIKFFSSCRCFNALTKKWREIAPMHSKRCYVSVATLDNIIYAIGGFDSHIRHRTAERYNFHTNQWTLIQPMDKRRSDACATTLNGFIYVVGGFTGDEYLASSEVYNPETDQWTTIIDMLSIRSGVCAISYHGKIYACGGFNGSRRLVSAERYDPDTNEWSAVPDMFNPRSNFGIEVLDDMIFVIGGFNGNGTIFHVECYDERSNEWYEATDMNTFRSALAACVVTGLPNVNDYVHQNRAGLLEEKRQKLIQQRALYFRRQHLLLLGGQNAEPDQQDDDPSDDPGDDEGDDQNEGS